MVKVDEKVEIKIVQSLGELIRLSSLIDKFFEEVKPDYTKKDFYENIPEMFYEDKGIVVYVTDDNIPKAYIIAAEKNVLNRQVVIIFQAYSERPSYLRKMKDTIDNWTIERGFTEQIILSTPKNQHYFEMNFNFQTKYVYMIRKLEEKIKPNGTDPTPEEIRERELTIIHEPKVK